MTCRFLGHENNTPVVVRSSMRSCPNRWLIFFIYIVHVVIKLPICLFQKTNKCERKDRSSAMCLLTNPFYCKQNTNRVEVIQCGNSMLVTPSWLDEQKVLSSTGRHPPDELFHPVILIAGGDKLTQRVVPCWCGGKQLGGELKTHQSKLQGVETDVWIWQTLQPDGSLMRGWFHGGVLQWQPKSIKPGDKQQMLDVAALLIARLLEINSDWNKICMFLQTVVTHLSFFILTFFMNLNCQNPEGAPSL